ncbi:four-carbon acid sugar kinase family protein [Halocynthiibacter sp. C4]|uniref:3-oxo-tetronate kinase n=1 Tax=Halocynthiibacter sp. C4 TaxID=2992758 RepID=UPI00237AFA36|nr:3-oxo-tetronate kinase [Halocynthiibacter sp. C4]MDE0590019.1 four-carbon acid sugar kinase family protein [Halocynthiibacter sp. C4]
MTNEIVGVIADDFTGATDVGGLLARTRNDVALYSGMPTQDLLQDASVHVVALKIRSTEVEEARAQAKEALARLRNAGATRIYWKICSTFDSTDKGNIGPVAEALMSEMSATYTVYCPAFPQNGRVVRDGILYVNGVPLAESPMKDHPLTPMRESDLVRVLSPQVSKRVSRQGQDRVATESLVEDGFSHFIADAVDGDDLETLGHEYGDLPLLVGGSAFAAAAYGAKDIQSVRRTPVYQSVSDGPALLISGSCSKATQEQVARYSSSGGRVIRIDPRNLSPRGEMELIHQVISQLGDTPLLLTSTTDPKEMRAIQAQMGAENTSLRIEGAMALCAAAARTAGATRFVVAGGETSGAVTSGLGADRLSLRNEIAPGVPWCLAKDQAGHFALALKSGNFGGPNFFLDALAAL